MAKKLKQYVRYDANRQLVPGSMVERYKQPAGKWEELVAPDPDGCCVQNNVGLYEYYAQTEQGQVTLGVAKPTYYLSDVYAPPEPGKIVLPIHTEGIASNYPGRLGYQAYQPQGPVQIYFNGIDSNNINWGNFSQFGVFLLAGFSSCQFTPCKYFKLTQNGVTVSYIINQSFPADFPAFTYGGGSIFHDEIFGTNPPGGLRLLYDSQKNVAFNYTDPIYLDFSY